MDYTTSSQAKTDLDLRWGPLPMPMPGSAPKSNDDAPLPQTHYTISEDSTAAGLLNKLYAIAGTTSSSSKEHLRFYPVPMPEAGLPHKVRPVAGPVHDMWPAGLRPTAEHDRRLIRSLTTDDLDKEGVGSFVHTSQITDDPVIQKSSQSYDIITGNAEDRPNMNQSHGINIGLMEQLIRRIQELEATNVQLQEHQKEEVQEQEINIQVFHAIVQEDDHMTVSSAGSECSDQSIGQGEISATFLSAPHWDVRDDHVSLRGSHHVPDPLGYVKGKGDVSFVIYKCYDIAQQRNEVNEAMRNNEALPEPTPISQDFMLVSEEMIEAAKSFFDQDAGFRNEFPWLQERKRMKPPFLWWYHYRRKLNTDCLQPRQRKLITKLILWLESTYGPLYDHVDAKFREGLVSSTYFQYLVRPGTVLVRDRGNLSRGYLAKSHPTFANSEHQKAKYTTTWEISATSLTYDGKLKWKDEPIKVQLVAGAANQDIPIRDLKYVPLDQSSAEVIRQLEARGQQRFWRNRRGQLVSYKSDTSGNKSVNERYMIDFRTYNELHRKTDLVDTFPGVPGSPQYIPKHDQGPGFPELYLFPSETKGFNFRTKKWSTLEVDLIREVNWNNKAFGSLVADDDTKEMIQALVSNQLAAQKGTDLIENKGNGLILLLHGPPGTGKTYTAESVAEIARKPLYPVTCGDIGTEPGEVEKYLDSVFYLGKIWDCVVLLDEAEVFLEQRTLNDLKRNALVSVFLRTLEYYEGILILTTNRVGTFDEAFKSRISLALRYEKLTQVQRKQVWRNFIRRLEDLGEQDSVDLEDLKLHIDELASYPMNGRQIRNSISTARQLALYKKTRMTSAHLRRSITLANKFDDYLGEVRTGELSNAEEAKKDGTLTDEYFAREDNLR